MNKGKFTGGGSMQWNVPSGNNWMCSKCNTVNWETDRYCMNCGKPRAPGNKSNKSIILYAIIALLLVLLVISVLRGWDKDGEKTGPEPGEAVAAVTPKATNKPVATPTPVPENITVHEDGRIDTKYEYIEGEKVVWTYCYDENNVFMYRTRTVANVLLSWSKECLPDSYTTFHWLEPVGDCLEFTYNFSIPKVYNGTCAGQRTLYIMDSEGWKTAAGFGYPGTGTVSVTVKLDEPTDVKAIGSLRIESDPESSYSIEGTLTDVLIVDYNY